MLEIVAATHTGMTRQFNDTVKQWLETAQHPRFNVPYTELVYQPMLELLAYFAPTASRPSSFRAEGSTSCAPSPRRATAFRRSR